MIEDLLKLELGITINIPFPRLVTLGVLVYSGDNLEIHNLGGFSCCFSSKDICRFCHATYLDLDSHIHDYDSDKPHDYWTTSEYDKICDALEEEEEDEKPIIESRVSTGNLFNEEDNEDDEADTYDDSSSENGGGTEEDESEEEAIEQRKESRFGLRKRCPLNQLKAFHSVLNFPPDIMHDHMEVGFILFY